MTDVHGSSKWSHPETELSTLLDGMREAGDRARAGLGHMSSTVTRPASALTNADVRQIRALQVTLRQRAGSRAGRWSIAALAAAAAVLVVALYLRSEHSAPVAQTRSVSKSPAATELASRSTARTTTVPSALSGPDAGGNDVRAETRIEAGTELAWTSNAALNMPSGARFKLSGVGRLTMQQVGPEQEVLRLEAGTVSVRVPKLPSGHAFEVRTPEARVVVVGTEFAVMRQVARTCVQVQEGIVRIHLPSGDGGKVLKAGNHWSSDGKRCISPRPARANSGGGSLVPSAPAGSGSPTHEAQQDGRSTLAEQNELLRQAVLLRKSGKRSESLAVLNEFERRFPSSPLLSLVVREKTKLETGP